MSEPTRVQLRPPAVRTVVVTGLAVLLLASLGFCVFFARHVLADRRLDGARDDAVAAASQLAVNFTTLDYRTFDRDSGRVVAGSTGTFKSEFQAQSAQLKSLVTQNRSVSKGKVLRAGVVSVDDDSARVLLVVDADVTNTAATQPVARHYRILLDLSKSGDRWLASQLQFAG